MARDSLQTFLFDNTDIRGAVVKLDNSFAELTADQGYDLVRQQLLAEFVAANVLITSNLKFEGSLSLQARAEGAVSLVMSECTSELNFRAVIEGIGDIEADTLGEVLSGGTLALTIEPAKGQRYQGIVALESADLAGCLSDYFERSEQLPTWFRFAMLDGRVCGVMLQAMPAQVCTDAEQRRNSWEHITHLAQTLKVEEMIELSNEEMLYRLYHEETVRLFEPQPVQFKCSCSRERMERALVNLGQQQLQEVLEEQGQVETQCHFCHTRYQFAKAEILHLLQGGEHSSH